MDLVARMIDPRSPVILLPGAGGVAPDPAAFSVSPVDPARFATIAYPGWRRYVETGFSAQHLIAELAATIASLAPHGPIRLVGTSIGGHFGYAAALLLQKMGREVSGFCAIDSFMISSSDPSGGWKGRALAEAWGLVRERRAGEFLRFARSKFWRALFRLAGHNLPNGLRRLAASKRSSLAWAFDPLFEQELSMRLLLRETAPYIASLDREPIALTAPAILIRTRGTAADDPAWRRRCPNLEIFEIPGNHHSLFEPENIGALRGTFIAATRHW